MWAAHTHTHINICTHARIHAHAHTHALTLTHSSLSHPVTTVNHTDMEGLGGVICSHPTYWNVGEANYGEEQLPKDTDHSKPMENG